MCTIHHHEDSSAIYWYLSLQFRALHTLLKGVNIGGNYRGAEASSQDFKLLTLRLTIRLELTDCQSVVVALPWTRHILLD